MDPRLYAGETYSRTYYSDGAIFTAYNRYISFPFANKFHPHHGLLDALTLCTLVAFGC